MISFFYFFPPSSASPAPPSRALSRISINGGSSISLIPEVSDHERVETGAKKLRPSSINHHQRCERSFLLLSTQSTLRKGAGRRDGRAAAACLSRKQSVSISQMCCRSFNNGSGSDPVHNAGEGMWATRGARGCRLRLSRPLHCDESQVLRSTAATETEYYWLI